MLNTTIRPLLLSLACASLLLAAGCRGVMGGACHKPQAYTAAENLPPLRVPGGLDGPETAEALKIPELAEPEAPVDPSGPCLEAPPAIVAPPLPPSNVAIPDGRTRRPRAAEDRPESTREQPAETEPQTERRRRPPSRPR